jgi:hypothetical protein
MRLRKHYYYRKATILAIPVGVDVHVAVNEINVFIFAMEVQKWFPFRLL